MSAETVCNGDHHWVGNRKDKTLWRFGLSGT